jgi:hypothetical protein
LRDEHWGPSEMACDTIGIKYDRFLEEGIIEQHPTSNGELLILIMKMVSGIKWNILLYDEERA